MRILTSSLFNESSTFNLPGIYHQPNWLFNRTSTSFAGSRLLTLALGLVRKMKLNFNLCILLASLLASFNPALADPVEPKVSFYCNQRSGALFISSLPTEQPSQPINYSKHSVSWISLLKMGPAKNNWGDPLRTGSHIATRRCGSITIKFSSGFLNSNPQGELGALDFPVIEIRQGKKVLLEKTALEQCAVGLSRYNYFGECPGSWAQSIEVLPADSGHAVHVKRIYTDEAYKDIERTDVYK